jgi:hypothetical protein
LTDNQNGNGFADYRLSRINLSGIGLTPLSQLIFHAVWEDSVAGSESFFLFNGGGGLTVTPTGDNQSPLPLPAAAWMFLAGLLGLGALATRRGKQLDVGRD